MHSLSTHSTPAWCTVWHQLPASFSWTIFRSYSLYLQENAEKIQVYSITPNWITLIKVEEELSYVTSAGRRDKGLIAKKGKHMFADVWQTSVVSYSLALVFWRILSRNNYLLVFFKINQFACLFSRSNLLVAHQFLKISKDEGLHWRTIAGMIILNVKYSYSYSNSGFRFCTLV